MSGYEVDMACEAAAAEQWEELNQCESDNFPDWEDAEKMIQEAIELLDNAETLLHTASGYVSGSTQEDKIESLADGIAELYFSLKNQKKEMEVR